MLVIIAITTNPKVKVIINASNTVIGFHLLSFRGVVQPIITAHSLQNNYSRHYAAAL